MGELGLQGDSVTLMVSGGIGVVQFVAVLPVIIFIDRLGKRPTAELAPFVADAPFRPAASFEM